MVLTLPERCEFRWGHGHQGEGMQRSEVPMEGAVGAGPWGGLSQEEAFGLSSSSPGRGASVPAKVTGQEVASFLS